LGEGGGKKGRGGERERERWDNVGDKDVTKKRN